MRHLRSVAVEPSRDPNSTADCSCWTGAGVACPVHWPHSYASEGSRHRAEEPDAQVIAFPVVDGLGVAR